MLFHQQQHPEEQSPPGLAKAQRQEAEALASPSSLEKGAFDASVKKEAQVPGRPPRADNLYTMIDEAGKKKKRRV